MQCASLYYIINAHTHAYHTDAYHTIIHIGNLANWGSPLARFGRDARVATGVGLVSTFFGIGRIELTYSTIHRQALQDQTARGQFGIGMLFY